MNLTHTHPARHLQTPSREAMLRRDPSVQLFWEHNRELCIEAWQQWGDANPELRLDDSLLDERLRTAVARAWEDPTTESAVRELLSEVAPGVFAFQFFDPSRLAELRHYLDEVWQAEIPLRPPFGIVLNRRGAMLDPRSDGYLAAPSFQAFYREMLDRYMRPISRLLFPEVVGYDTQTFGFSINYKPSTDTSIQPHSDASTTTLNINLNVPGEEFTGSTVDFFDSATGTVHPLSFEPGKAMIHRGYLPHAAQPITSGERTNFVLWLYGDRGRVAPPTTSPGDGVSVAASQRDDARQRWSVPEVEYDDYAPF